ncbi:MAG: hypothetical protein JXB42_08555 [Deltaproteobacteria bacterium]|nr:hypothetical protein [Deltaproteobacteria bacterium]
MEHSSPCCRRIVLIALIPAFFFITSGCGKKGDPIYREAVYPAAVSDLSASLKGKGIELCWNLPDESGGIRLVRILKGETKLDSDFCDTCPRNFYIMGEFSTKDPLLSKRNGFEFGYRDKDIREGFLYSYRVLLCASSGACSGESNLAEVKFE